MKRIARKIFEHHFTTLPKPTPSTLTLAMEAAMQDLPSRINEIAKHERWSSMTVIDGLEKRFVASTTKIAPLHESQLGALLAIFDDHESTVGRGLEFGTTHFNVHRLYPDTDPALVYGRQSGCDPNKAEGFALCRAGTTWILVTFAMPLTTAHTVPRLIDLSKWLFVGHE